MKRVLILTMMVAFLLAFSDRAPAQVTKTVKNVEKKIGNTIEKEIGNLFKKKKPTEDEKKDSTAKADVAGTSTDQPVTEQTRPELSWAKYDFIPGDQVIFEDNLAGEENGEFPSRWDLHDGSIEVAVLDNENVIMFREYGSTIIPYMKDPKSDYLPDIFTIEFDAYIPNNSISVYLFDMKNQSSPPGRTYLDVWGDMMEFKPASSKLPGGEKVNNQWAHVAVAFTKGQLKAYLNETRLINIPRLSFNPTGISIRALHSGDNNHFYIKNIRIAEGGVKYYDRFMQDGKIIANGIRFDVNKATLKPESMGIINEIAGLMKAHPEVKFSVEGHTDSDGDDAFNQTLSEQRAATVVSTLTGLGIDADRLTSKGWGETRPLDNNSTPEGKANNRRVEFVKK